MIARGEPLDATLDQLCVHIEPLLDGGSCTILSVDAAGLIHPLAAPSFPEAYRTALDGIPVGPDVGSCGTAIYHNVPVTVEDIEHDPKWAAFKTLALPLGWRACCSVPLTNEQGKVLGAIALYFRERRGPTLAERNVLKACVGLCELAMRRHERVLARERRATLDALTGLPNRAAFDDALSRMRCELPGSWGLLIVDIDNLKTTNDTFGHDVGDALLRVASRQIAQSLVPDTTFRIGGDEFVAIIQDKTALQDLERKASCVFDALAAPAECAGHTILPKATIGGAILAPQDLQPENVHRHADFALYHAKETKRGGFILYWSGIGTKITHRRTAIRDVTLALQEGRMEAWYQPVFRLDTMKVAGLEALSRMTNAFGTALPASLFQEAFDDAHVATELTAHILDIVAKDIRKWLDAGLPVPTVSINVTSADFYKGSLLPQIEHSLGAAGIPLHHLAIEVTENAYIGQRDRVVAEGIEQLRLKRVRVALDDFGTGFAALTHLLTVPVDSLKIDRSFVRRLDPGDPGIPIIKGILQIAGDLGISVIAEGIETEDQASVLRDMGCLLGQGYTFGKPAERDAITALLREHGDASLDAAAFEPPMARFKNRRAAIGGSFFSALRQAT